MTGSVARIMGQKGYGFIWGEDGVEYFFHKDDFAGSFDNLVDDVLRRGKIQVSFQTVQTAKGMRAHEVARMDGTI